MESDLQILLRGVVLGLILSAPVGPIGLLCIRRTVEQGLPAGLATGLGAALADTLIGALAAFGVTQALHWVQQQENILRLLGGMLLVIMAVAIAHKIPRSPTEQRPARGLVGMGLSGLMLTLTNPVTVLAALAVVATFGGHLAPVGASLLVGGIFLGALLWWSLLCGLMNIFRDRFSPKAVLRLNRVTGAILAGIGGYVLISGLVPIP